MITFMRIDWRKDVWKTVSVPLGVTIDDDKCDIAECIRQIQQLSRHSFLESEHFAVCSIFHTLREYETYAR